MQFHCRLGLPDGRIVEETHQAHDLDSLRLDLERRGISLFEAKARGLSWGRLTPSKRASRQVLSDQEFLIFNQEMAALLKAGLPLLQTLDLMLERMRPGRFRDILTDIKERIKSGQELSDAFEAYGDFFPRLYPSSLKAGEKSGELEKVLRRFVRYLKLVTDAKKRMVSALVYPAVLMGLSTTMILVLSIFVVPKFQDFFLELDVDLPLISKITLGFSLFLVNNLMLISVALVVAGVLFWQWKKTDGGMVALDRLKLRLPLLGGILHRFALSEFCRSLSTLLAGGIPLVSAFEISSRAMSNSFVRKKLSPTIDRVREGRAFHAALEESGVFLPLGIELVKVGEATGALDEMLGTISDFFDEEVETRLQRLLSLVEPLMLIFLGAVIAIILISIYLPLFASLSQSKF